MMSHVKQERVEQQEKVQPVGLTSLSYNWVIQHIDMDQIQVLIQIHPAGIGFNNQNFSKIMSFQKEIYLVVIKFLPSDFIRTHVIRHSKQAFKHDKQEQGLIRQKGHPKNLYQHFTDIIIILISSLILGKIIVYIQNIYKQKINQKSSQYINTLMGTKGRNCGLVFSNLWAIL